MGIFSEFHWLIIALVAFLLFGNRLPSIMRSLGSGISEFKKGMNDLHNEVRKGADEARERLTVDAHGGQAAQSEALPAEARPAETAPAEARSSEAHAAEAPLSQ